VKVVLVWVQVAVAWAKALVASAWVMVVLVDLVLVDHRGRKFRHSLCNLPPMLHTSRHCMLTWELCSLKHSNNDSHLRRPPPQIHRAQLAGAS
jgi:hypothetical protein